MPPYTVFLLGGGDFEVYMGMYVIEKDQELARKVCEVLRRMLEEAINKGKERRAKAMTRLNCPPRANRHNKNKQKHQQSAWWARRDLNPGPRRLRDSRS